MSMDLDWSKEIHTLNKVILDWRWKVFAAKVDSAKLKSAVTEFLFSTPNWSSTYCHISNTMRCLVIDNYLHYLREKWHELLSEVKSQRLLHPLRHTKSLAADSNISCCGTIVTLNSVNSPAGETTRVRLCSLSGQPNLGLALQRLNALKKFSNENENRIITSIKYLKQLGLEIKPRIAKRGTCCYRNPSRA